MTRHLLGIDIGGTKTAIIYATLDDEVKLLDRLAFKTGDVDSTIRRIVNSMHVVIDRHRLEPACISGIGISCGGPLDSGKGVIMSPPNLPGWDNVPIVDIIRSHFNGPCAIQNDANACALAEWRFGAGRGTRNMVFLTFGTGLGAGIIINGQLYTGANDNAGEVGHIRLSKFGPIGYGKQGSFEGFASGGGIAQLARTKLMEQYQRGRKVEWCSIDQIDEVSAKLVAEQARRGDKLALDIIGTSARYLGRGLAILVDVLNPERIVIGSIYARNTDLFFPVMEQELRKEALDVSLGVCEVRPAELGEQIGDYAAVSIAAGL